MSSSPPKRRLRRKSSVLTLHLIATFWILFLVLFKPILKDHFIQKSHQLLFEEVLKQDPTLIDKIQAYHLEKSPFTLAPFLALWLLFSLIIAALLWYNIEGGKQCAWLLPLLILCYAFFIKRPELNPPQTNFERLEKILKHEGGNELAEYLFGPPGPTTLILFLGWNLFFAFRVNYENKKHNQAGAYA